MKKIMIGIGIALVIAIVVVTAMYLNKPSFDEERTTLCNEIKEAREERIILREERITLLVKGFEKNGFTVERNGYILKLSHPSSVDGVFDDFRIDTSSIEQEKIYYWRNNSKRHFKAVVAECECDDPWFLVDHMATTFYYSDNPNKTTKKQ